MIAAVVVTYSAPPGMLESCLAALVRGGGIDTVLVVDTGGRVTPAQVEQAADDGSNLVGDGSNLVVELISTANRGYGAAANAGFRRAAELSADTVVLLNDDVIVSPGWMAGLVSELDGDVGAAQPALLFPPDEQSPGAGVVNSLGVRLSPDGSGTDIGRGTVFDPAMATADLEIFTGGAVAFSPAFLVATGGFDERWFLYYEDVDLALRGRRLGWSYRIVPSSAVVHHGGVTTGSDPSRTRYLQERNRLRAAFRFGDPATIARAVWLSTRRLRHPPRATHARALLVGLGGAPMSLARRVRRADRLPFVS